MAKFFFFVLLCRVSFLGVRLVDDGIEFRLDCALIFTDDLSSTVSG